MSPDPLLHARALVLSDLSACGSSSPETVSLVEDVLAQRRWWVREWPEGGAYVAGQVAQDVQDRLEDSGDRGRRWPPCPRHPDGGHELRITPELGPDPHWTCEEDGVEVAPLGALADRHPRSRDPRSSAG